MYVCKHCGYVSHNESINYCNNIKCKFYGYYCAPEEPEPMRGRMTDMRGCQPVRDMRMTEMQGRQPVQDMRMTETPMRDMRMTETPMREPVRGHMTETPVQDMRGMREMPGYEQQRRTPCHPMPEVKSGGMLGLATVPMQEFKDIYPIKKALEAGTLFPELDMPYTQKIIRRG